jgi:hypothetical protein
MKARGFWTLNDVSDRELVGRLRELVSRSSWTEARIVAHLAELDARKLHLRMGRSLFRYCLEALGLSQNEAHYRIQAARIARKFPIVFELLDKRQIHLTALALIRDYVTPENHLELLREVSGKTKEQILHLLAVRAPRPDVKSRIRRLPVPAGAVAVGPTGTLEPRSAESYRLQLNISAGLKRKLEQLLDMTSHSNPSRDLAIAVERAVDTEIERVKKRRFGQTSRPRRNKAGSVTTSFGGTGGETIEYQTTERQTAEPQATECQTAEPQATECQTAEPQATECQTAEHQTGAPATTGEEAAALRLTLEARGSEEGKRRGWLANEGGRHISNEVRRQVVARDGLSCSFVGEDGRRCGAQAFLQLDHERARAKRGQDTVDNLRWLCADHNRLRAEQEFGAAHVAAAIARRRRAP